MTCVTACLLVLALSLTGWTSRFDNLVYDAVQSELNNPVSDKILIVAIDEQSLKALGKWPWPRQEFISGFSQLTSAQPKAVAFDILLSEPSSTQNDAALAAAMASIPRLYLPMQIVAPGTNGKPYDIILPLSIFQDAASGMGNVNISTDDDGIVRRLRPCFQPDANTAKIPHIIVQLAGKMPSGSCNQSKLFQLSPLPDFQTVSWVDLAHGEVPAMFLENKYILIGATADGLGDRYIAADGDSGTMAGITVMANYLNAIIRNNFITVIEQPWHALLSVIPVLLLMIGQLLWRPRTILYASGIGLLAVVLVAVGLLQSGIWLAPGPALSGLLLVYPLWGWRRLQAAVDYMSGELRRMEMADGANLRMPLTTAPIDILTEKSERLASAITELQNLRRFTADTLQQLPDPLLVTNNQQVIIYANASALYILGDDYVDSKLRECLIAFSDRSDISGLLAYLETAMSAMEPPGAYHEFSSVSGREYAMRCIAVLDHLGERNGHILYLADVTATAIIQRDREAVLQLLSHDMRAPQSAILALTEQISSTENLPEMTRRIAQQAHRTLGLADNFVDLARMQAVSFEPEDILLQDLLREAADGLWGLASPRGIQFSFADASRDGFVAGERSGLFRAFTNLFDNAIKYSPDGGIISVALERAIAPSQPEVIVRVSDQGPGIAPEMLDILFQRFASYAERNRNRVKGIGLGLNYIETVIVRHKGSITASNPASGGAQFIITLPIAE